jgi:anti-anti-sigma factor
LILRPEGRIYFANAQNIADSINALITEYQPRVVTLDMSRVPDIEYSALQMLIEGEKRSQGRGATLWLAALNPSALKVVRLSGLANTLGSERLLFNARAAIERFRTMPPEAAEESAKSAAE